MHFRSTVQCSQWLLHDEDTWKWSSISKVNTNWNCVRCVTCRVSIWLLSCCISLSSWPTVLLCASRSNSNSAMASFSLQQCSPILQRSVFRFPFHFPSSIPLILANASQSTLAKLDSSPSSWHSADTELATLMSVSCVCEHRAQRANAVTVVWVDAVDNSFCWDDDGDVCCFGRREEVCCSWEAVDGAALDVEVIPITLLWLACASARKRMEWKSFMMYLYSIFMNISWG